MVLHQITSNNHFILVLTRNTLSYVIDIDANPKWHRICNWCRCYSELTYDIHLISMVYIPEFSSISMRSTRIPWYTFYDKRLIIHMCRPTSSRSNCVTNTEGWTKCMSFHHDDVIKWKHFPRYWPFVRGIHRSPVNSPHKGQWRGALIFTLICARITGWVNNCEAGDLRRNRDHYDVIVMTHAILVQISPQFVLKGHYVFSFVVVGQMALVAAITSSYDWVSLSPFYIEIALCTMMQSNLWFEAH